MVLIYQKDTLRGPAATPEFGTGQRHFCAWFDSHSALSVKVQIIGINALLQ